MQRKRLVFTVLLLAGLAPFVVWGAGSEIDLAGYPSPARLAVEGGAAQIRAGDALVAADLNGDGADDIVIAARLADPAGRVNAGEVYIVYGGASAQGTVFLDDSFAGPRLRGAVALDQFGESLAVGDFNGDRIADLAVGASWAAPAGRTDAGTVYLFFGGIGAFASVDLANQAAPLTILGATSGDRAGGAVTMADLDGDGLDDLIIAARRASPAGRIYAGKVYVVKGRSGASGAVDLSANPGIWIDGPMAGSEFGAALAGDDFDGDGRADLLVGAPYAAPLGRSGAGMVFLVKGRAPLASLDLATHPADFTIFGAAPNDRLGAAVAMGDLDGDGKADLVAGAPEARRNDLTSAGAVYGLLGTALVTSTVDLSTASAALSVEGNATLDRFGSSLAAVDLDGDLRSDLLAGAPFADPVGRQQAGAIFVFGGTRAMGTRLPAAAADLIILGADDGDAAGSSLAVADVTGDRVGDMIIGSPKAESVLGAAAGRVYLLAGPFVLNATPAAIQTSTATPTWTPSPVMTPTVTRLPRIRYLPLILRGLAAPLSLSLRTPVGIGTQ